MDRRVHKHNTLSVAHRLANWPWPTTPVLKRPKSLTRHPPLWLSPEEGFTANIAMMGRGTSRCCCFVGGKKVRLSHNPTSRCACSSHPGLERLFADAQFFFFSFSFPFSSSHTGPLVPWSPYPSLLWCKTCKTVFKFVQQQSLFFCDTFFL